MLWNMSAQHVKGFFCLTLKCESWAGWVLGFMQMVSHRAGCTLWIPRMTDERAPEFVYFNSARAEDDKCSLHPATSRFTLFILKGTCTWLKTLATLIILPCKKDWYMQHKYACSICSFWFCFCLQCLGGRLKCKWGVFPSSFQRSVLQSYLFPCTCWWLHRHHRACLSPWALCHSHRGCAQGTPLTDGGIFSSEQDIWPLVHKTLFILQFLQQACRNCEYRTGKTQQHPRQA